MRSKLFASAIILASLSSSVHAQVASEASQSVEQAPQAYRINAGDELEIYVWGEERLQRNVRVLPDGTLAFPLVGQVSVEGLLPQELEALIVSGLAEQYRGDVPQVTVSVIAPTGLQFSILGRVNSPGSFTPGRYINVLEALSLAGGPNEFANLNDIVILREVDGEIKAIPVRVGRLFRTGANSNDVESSLVLRNRIRRHSHRPVISAQREIVSETSEKNFFFRVNRDDTGWLLSLRGWANCRDERCRYTYGCIRERCNA